MNQKSLRWVKAVWFNIFSEMKSWAVKQWVLYFMTERAEIRMICEDIKKWEAFLIRLREKKLLKSYMKD